MTLGIDRTTAPIDWRTRPQRTILESIEWLQANWRELWDEYEPTNRERSREPRLGRTWCWGCDAARVSDGQRCPNCGRVHRRGQRDKGRAR